jgi:hypothetical protein
MQFCSPYSFGVWAFNQKNYNYRLEMHSAQFRSSVEAQKETLRTVARNQGSNMQNGSKLSH